MSETAVYRLEDIQHLTRNGVHVHVFPPYGVVNVAQERSQEWWNVSNNIFKWPSSSQLQRSRDKSINIHVSLRT